jgi:uncharacterized damage-inducible protein DinB
MSLEDTVAELDPSLRNKKPEGLPHSIWDIVEHIRIAQRDLLDFCRNADYHHDMTWPDDYWPKDTGPISNDAWAKSLSEIERVTAELKAFTTDEARDLTAKIPAGTGQTYLRTVLVALDHTSYHSGEIVAIRRLLRAWPPA